MINVMKILNHESIDSILESYYNSDKLVEEKIKNNLKTLYAREDISKEERGKLALECGKGLEMNCYIEMGYFNETSEYFFDAKSVNWDFNEPDYYDSLEELVQAVNRILPSTFNGLYGTRMKPLFYTVIDHESVNSETTEAQKAFREFVGLLNSRGLTDKEIEKFQNLFKAAVN